MIVTLHKEPFHFLYLEDVYTSDELSLIWQELEFLNSNNKLFCPNATGTAIDGSGSILKKNTGLILDQLYTGDYRKFSNILSVNRKIFDINILLNKDSWFFSNAQLNFDTTLISYYENSDYYKPHHDNCRITACTWFFKEPKKFRGGDLYFVDYNVKVEVKNNTTVIFPSSIRHAVDEVELPQEHVNKGFGRYCMSQFMDFIE